ncbi:MAG: hypothetical protein V1859_03550 [archaeon]
MQKNECLGINFFPSYSDKKQLKQCIQLIDNLNSGWVRLDFDWYSNLNIDYYDELILELIRKKIKILGLVYGLIHGTLKSFLFNKKRKSPLDNLNDYKSFLERVCKRYSSYINYWEIWNEENTNRFWFSKPSVEEYSLLLRESNNIIKKISGKNKIVLGGIAGNDIDNLPFAQKNFVLSLIKNNQIQYVDVLAIHPYIIDCFFSLSKKKRKICC